MDQSDDQPDPFAGLEDWAKEAERRVRRESRRAGRGRLLPRAALIVVAVLGAVAVAAALPTVRSWLPGASAASTVAYPTASVPPGITVTTSQSAAPTDPFADTPAATYPKGAAGITLPPARAVTGFTEAQVAAALRQVRAAMIATHLDDRMLIGHDPATLLGMLAPNARAQIRGWFKTSDFDTLAVWIDPSVRLDPREQPRVSGRITYASVISDGLRTLRVTTNFVWVYAFDLPEDPLAVQHDETAWEFPSTRNLRAGDRGMWVRNTKGYSALIDCAAAAHGLLAPTRVPVAPQPNDTEDPKNYLRADHSLDIGDDCGTASRPSASVSPSSSASASGSGSRSA